MTVSASADNFQVLLSKHQETAIHKMVWKVTISSIIIQIDFVCEIDFTGIELDWENFGNWSPETYQSFKYFVNTLGSALHGTGFPLPLEVTYC